MPVISEARSELSILVPSGYLVTRQSLLKRGASPHSLDNLLKSGQIKAPISGVYCKPETNVSWQTVVCSLKHMESDLVVGGLTALQLQGYAQYLPVYGDMDIQLWGYDKMPAWINKLSLPNRFVYHNQNNLIPKQLKGDYPETKFHSGSNQGVPISIPEQAILQAVFGIPQTLSFEHADELMQGLVNLSPKKLDLLLSTTISVKTKRLFLWLAERQGHEWFKRLDIDAYDLGQGKRVIAKHGKLEKKYSITIPEAMNG